MALKDAISELQKELNLLGNNLVVDGVFGPKTEAALKDALDGPNEVTSDIAKEIVRNNPAINPKALARALKWKDNKAISNKNYLTIVDFSKNDSQKRMHVINMETLESVSYKVAHGKNSDANKDGMPDSFSNVSGSYKSSLGAVAIGSIFKNVKWKYVRLLEGLEKGLNDQIRKREILLHSSTYVNDIEGRPIGDTLGCFGVSEATAAKIFPILGGTLLYAWDDSLV